MAHFLGTNEYMILLAVLHLGDAAWGATILQELEEATGRAPSSGSLSTTLDRLEEKGLVRSSYEEGAPDRGGRPRRVVAVTAAGHAELAATRQAFRRLESNLPDRPGSLGVGKA